MIIIILYILYLYIIYIYILDIYYLLMHAPTQFQSDCSDHSQSPRPLQGCQAAGKMDWTSDFANLFKQGRACGGFLEGVGSCSPG